ncbi:MAG: hypothetical protein ACYS8I_17195 [Planctomycetota bacterium]
MRKLNIERTLPIIKMAIEEDLGQGDITSELLFKDDTIAKSNIISREEIVVCGMDVVREILRHYNERLKLKVLVNDGESAYVGCRIASYAQLSAKTQRNSYDDAQICPCHSRNESQDLRYKKDNARLANPRKVRSPLRRRFQSPAGII